MSLPENLHTPTDHIAWDLMHQCDIGQLQEAANDLVKLFPGMLN